MARVDEDVLLPSSGVLLSDLYYVESQARKGVGCNCDGSDAREINLRS